MVLFLKDHQFTFDYTSKYIPYKRKQEIRRKIVENGGTISYLLNGKTKFFVSANKDIGTTYKGITALKLGIPIVSLSFVDDCHEKQTLLDINSYLVAGKTSENQFSSASNDDNTITNSKIENSRSQKPLSTVSLQSTRVYLFKDGMKYSNTPFFPATEYEIIKHAWFKRPENDEFHFFAVELHASVMDSDVDERKHGPAYRIFTHLGLLAKSGIKDGKKECYFASAPNDAEHLYVLLCEKQSTTSYQQLFTAFPASVGSEKMLLTNLESVSSNQENGISSAVSCLVHSLWSEAVGEMTSLLSVPVKQIKIEDINKAEAVLLALRDIMNDDHSSSEELKKLSDEFYSLLPHNSSKLKDIKNKRVLIEKQDLCQLIKDMVRVNEATNYSHQSSIDAKYRALRCHLEVLSKSNEDYKNVLNNIRSTQYSSNINVENIFSCNRPIESNNFSNLDNIHQLFHSSKTQNFLGILSRGLLLPKLIVDDYGGERTDIGHLGTGIYFASAAGASVKYSSAGEIRASRFMLVCDVALGIVKDYTEYSTELDCPPENYNSCHGVRRQEGKVTSVFEDDEYVIYTVNQQKIRYVIEFTLPGDKLISNEEFNVTLNEENLLCAPTNPASLDEKDDLLIDKISDVDISDVENIEDPLSKVQAGLRYDGESLVPLDSVHIRAKLLDLCAKVVVMQVYKNPNPQPIEAKYVFPLDDMAAVCGFEAFINGKHIIGEVKEKEQAHKEYKKAISEGHGAYLMDEETPDVFSVSVGNIPAGATVLIKISYVAELPVEGELIKFNLPGSLAPWKRDQALKENTQDDLDTVTVSHDHSFELSVHIALEMPFDIRTMQCPTHEIKTKKTATKAVIEMKEGQNLQDGFQLLIGLAEMYVPRMWVELHPEKPDSHACMLTFYPEFEAQPMNNVEFVFLLDLSCSMKGTPLDNAKKVLLLALRNLPRNSRFNVIAFGDHWIELFPTSILKTDKFLEQATDFVKGCHGDMGSSDLWKILKALNMLPVRTDVEIRNVCVISDGHLSEEQTTMNLISINRSHSRIFTFSVGSSSNRYLMRAMARVGAGAAEYFDEKVKSKWKRKVQSQLMKSQQPVLTSVTVAWQQFDDDAPKPIQAPGQIISMFNGYRQVVYGFVPYCSQAVLKAEMNGKEISTMVSTSELNKTSGVTLHQLTARALINDWEEGSLAMDQLQHHAVKRKQKDYIIEISKAYSVTSQFTSFVAIEHREEMEKFDTTPNIQEILGDENVDILSYIGWEEEEDEKEEEEKAEEEEEEEEDEGEDEEEEEEEEEGEEDEEEDEGEEVEEIYEDELSVEKEEERSKSSIYSDIWFGYHDESEEDIYEEMDDLIDFSCLFDSEYMNAIPPPHEASPVSPYDHFLPPPPRGQTSSLFGTSGTGLFSSNAPPPPPAIGSLFGQTAPPTLAQEQCFVSTAPQPQPPEPTSLSTPSLQGPTPRSDLQPLDLNQHSKPSLSFVSNQQTSPTYEPTSSHLLPKSSSPSYETSISSPPPPQAPPPPRPPKQTPHSYESTPPLSPRKQLSLLARPSLVPLLLPKEISPRSTRTPLVASVELHPRRPPGGEEGRWEGGGEGGGGWEGEGGGEGGGERGGEGGGEGGWEGGGGGEGGLEGEGGGGWERGGGGEGGWEGGGEGGWEREGGGEGGWEGGGEGPFEKASPVKSCRRSRSRISVPATSSRAEVLKKRRGGGEERNGWTDPISSWLSVQPPSLSSESHVPHAAPEFKEQWQEIPDSSPRFGSPVSRAKKSKKRSKVVEKIMPLEREISPLNLCMKRSITRDAPRKVRIEPLDKEIIVKLFDLQSDDGSWNIPDSSLETFLDIDTNEVLQLLKDSGAMSLGPPVFRIVCKILATLLVLAFLRHHYPLFFPLRLLPPFKPRKKLEETGTTWRHQTEKALTWLKTADAMIPCLCTRLQLGVNWEEVMPKLLKLPTTLV